MKWPTALLSLALVLAAAPALAVDAVPFAGFSGLVLGNPGVPQADIPARNFIAIYSLAEHGGPAEVGVRCELEGPGEELGHLKAPPRLTILVTLFRSDGTRERIAKLKMRVLGNEAETSKRRDFFVGAGDYLLYEIRVKGAMRLAPGQRLILSSWAGAPGSM